MNYNTVGEYQPTSSGFWFEFRRRW